MAKRRFRYFVNPNKGKGNRCTGREGRDEESREAEADTIGEGGGMPACERGWESSAREGRTEAPWRGVGTASEAVGEGIGGKGCQGQKREWHVIEAGPRADRSDTVGGRQAKKGNGTAGRG